MIDEALPFGESFGEDHAGAGTGIGHVPANAVGVNGDGGPGRDGNADLRGRYAGQHDKGRDKQDSPDHCSPS